MIIVYVKHYLNENGMRFFDKQWFPEVDGLIRQQKGFILIEAQPDLHDFECVNITVKFENKKTLNAWGATPDHGRVINQLEPYRTKPWNYAVTEDEFASLDSLEWGEVPLLPLQDSSM
jgi:heme-degrading monooxygenase HmoA